MTPRMIQLLSAAALISAVPAQAEQRAPDQRLAYILDGRTAGQPTDCIDLSRVSSTEIVPSTAIVYHMNDGTIVVNRPADATFLDPNDILVTDTPTTRLCNVDIVRLVDSGSHMPSGSVGLGMFVPYPRSQDRRTR